MRHWASTVMPSSTASPASRASSTLGTAPAPISTRSAGWLPSVQTTWPGPIEAAHGDAGADVHAFLAVEPLVEARHDRPDAAAHHARRLLQHRDLEAQLGGDGCQLEPDIAAADHDQRLARLELRPQRLDVGDGAQEEHAVSIGAGQGDRAGAAAGGEHEGRIGQARSVGENDALSSRSMRSTVVPSISRVPAFS